MNRSFRVEVRYAFNFWGFLNFGIPCLGGPQKKDESILGSGLGSPYFRKLPLPLTAQMTHIA